MRKKILMACMVLFCFLLFACSPEEKDAVLNQKPNQAELEQEDGKEPAEEAAVEPELEATEDVNGEVEIEKQEEKTLVFELEEHDGNRMQKADGWSNGFMFDCTWRGDNVSFDNGIMMLKIDQDGENASPKWSGGEYRTRDFYHYGTYEVRMKPIKNDGVVSSFFTYTGPSDSNPWDEIDIEFLGKDTTKVQFNYFTNGVGDHEFIYELGYDASEEFHVYGFEWLEDSITWYVDGVAVHTATKEIPSTPSKIMMNVWPGTGVDVWLNAFDGKVPLQGQYDWFQYTEGKEQN